MFGRAMLLCSLILVTVCKSAEVVIRPVGDETKLTEIKAEPVRFRGSKFILTGVCEVDDYYNYGYANSQNTKYSLRFLEVTEELKNGDIATGEACHFYLDRVDPLHKEVVDQIVATAPKMKALRVLGTLLPFGRDDFQWNMMELRDVQFLQADNTWSDWYVASNRQAIDKKRNEKEAADAAIKKARMDREAAEAQAKKEAIENLRWRKWTAATGGQTLEAKILFVVGADAVLENADGKRINVPISKLSDADQEFIRTKQWLPSKSK